jgi:hypothetical protein
MTQNWTSRPGKGGGAGVFFGTGSLWNFDWGKLKFPARPPSLRGRLVVRKENEIMTNARSRTRAERERRMNRARALFLLAAILAVIAFTYAWLGPDPVPGERVPEGAATFAAAREYDRALELYGDPAVAGNMAEIKYASVLEEWRAGE